MKTLRRVLAAPKRWLSRKGKPEEQLFCTETSCGHVKKRGGSLNEPNPARDNCFNISYCKL